jgi:hypothetical protein
VLVACLPRLQAADLAAFLAERDAAHGLSSRHAWRITRLVERVLLIYHQELGLPPSSAVAQLLEQRPDIRYANASRFDELPDVLGVQDAARLARHVAQPSNPGNPWQMQRNRAAVALHLGRASPQPRFGLRLGDLAPAVCEAVTLPGPSGQAARRVPLPVWARRAVQTWREARARWGCRRAMPAFHPVHGQALGQGVPPRWRQVRAAAGGPGRSALERLQPAAQLRPARPTGRVPPNSGNGWG